MPARGTVEGRPAEHELAVRGAGPGAVPGPAGRPRTAPSRRAVLVAVPVLAGAGAAGGWQGWRARHAREPAFGLTAARTWDGSVVLVQAAQASGLDPTTRVLADPAHPGQVAAARDQESAWVRAGRVPGAGGRWASMGLTALLDLRVMLTGAGALLAGWPAAWRYVWPRDASFCAVALAASGHLEDAIAVLGFLQRVAPVTGPFHARYRPDGSGPPDRRPAQADGAGWACWALLQVLDRAPAADRPALLRRFRVLLDRSTASMLASLDPRTGLPRPSPDYWEVRERSLTLGVAAPVLAGLQAAADLYVALDDRVTGPRAAAAAGRLAGAVEQTFGPGYPRHPGQDDPDAAVTFLSTPIGRSGAALGEVQRRHRSLLGRPAGGLAPGVGWKRDGVSWTPETALYALAAAGRGDVAEAAGLLDWLDRHRTGLGSIPEKVLYDGSAAGPAPLTWTAALVLLTLDLLGEPAG